MGHYVPHTDDEWARMLADLGLSSTDDLFAAVPEALRLRAPLPLAPGVSEAEVADALEALAARNRPAASGVPAGGTGGLVCFAGGGAYDHDIPAVVRALTGRSEFVTAYTPYQPEVSQGVLQILFEFQTFVARITGTDVANASLYDGATALVEAVNLAVADRGRNTVWVSDGVPPAWRATLATLAAGTGHDLVPVPLADGRTRWPEPGGESPGVLVLQYPNYLGCLEDVPAAVATARALGAAVVVGFDPVAAGLLVPPGRHGVDVVVAEGQPFGIPLSFGGPYLGMLGARAGLLRRLPGRIVGETVDDAGRRAYVSTLRTREQDIRREKASSNICTNQTLMAVAATVHLSWLGTGGLRAVGLACARGARYCREALLGLDGVEPLAGAPVFREFALRVPVPAPVLVERLLDEGFLGGVALPEALAGDEHGWLVAVTERRTRAEIDAFVAAAARCLR